MMLPCSSLLLIILVTVTQATFIPDDREPRQQQASLVDRLVSLPGQFFTSLTNSSSVPGCGRPPSTPLGITLRTSDFINWSEALSFKSYWTAEPETAEDVVVLANWAYTHGYTLRPRGYMHSWAPLTITSATPCARVLLVDTTKHLNNIRLNQKNESDPYAPMTVTVGTGAHWEGLLTYLEGKGMGIFSFPAVGKMTLGGTLAVGAHGTGLPTKASKLASGFRTGSISNLITKLDAIVWSYETNAYELRTFTRYDEATPAFLVHLGRAFITSVTLLVDSNYQLRCQSITNIPSDALFARDTENTLALANFVDTYDRVEAQFFPYTDKTWLKLWTEEPSRASNALAISSPYPYTHGQQVSRQADRLIALLASGVTRLTPLISRMTYELGVSGVALTRTSNVWGWSKNSLLYYHHLAHKFISLGYVVLTTRDQLQKAVNKAYLFYTRLSDEMATQGKYPMNQPIEFRITGLDQAQNVNGTTFKPPSLSPLREVEGHPEYDVAVFLGLHYFPGTPHAAEFMQEWESFLFSTFNGGSFGTARVEWAKTWGFDINEAWVNTTVINQILPKTFGSEWNWAVQKLDEFDPHHLFSNDFVDKLTLPLP